MSGRYRVRDGVLYVHRKTSFESVGLERVVLTQGRGFGPINHILSKAGLAEAGCFLAGRREKYAYISITALLAVLESHDPIIVCLEDKEDFTQVGSGNGCQPQLVFLYLYSTHRSEYEMSLVCNMNTN